VLSNNASEALNLILIIGLHTETLAIAYLKQGRKDEALAEVQKAVELVNRVSVALKTLGYVQAMLGNRTGALALVYGT